MKKIIFMCVLWLLSSCMVGAQNRMLKRETSKMYNSKIKEGNKHVSGSSIDVGAYEYQY